MVGYAPVVATQQKFRTDRAADDYENELEHGRGSDIRDARPADHADHDRQNPKPEYITAHRRFRLVSKVGAQRDRYDHCERGADAQLHSDVIRHAEITKYLVEHGNGDRSAADPEKAGQ